MIYIESYFPPLPIVCGACKRPIKHGFDNPNGEEFCDCHEAFYKSYAEAMNEKKKETDDRTP